MPHVGDILVGRYRIDAPLGAGGSAVVYRAHDLRLRRDVALKLLLPNLATDPAVAHRFEREARSLAAVSHPGIVAVHDVEAGDPRSGREPFFVMELCDRGSLADRLVARGGMLPPSEVVPAIADVAGGLTSLHARGFVHRDVKPHNILLTADGAKLGDFGIARSGDTTDALTGPGSAVGTLAYLAPELLAGGTATPEADVFALGVVAYQALTGRLPRPAGSVVEFVAAHRQPAPAVSELRPDLGPYFDEVIDSALAADPAVRPTPLRFAGALKAAAAEWQRAGRRPSSPDAVAPGGAPPGSGSSDAVDGPRRGVRDEGRRPIRLAPPDPSVEAAARTVTVRTRAPRRADRPDWLPARRRRLLGPAVAALTLVGLAGLVLVALLGGLGFLGAAPTLPVPSQSATASTSLAPTPTSPASPSPSPSASSSASPSASPPASASAPPSPTALPTPSPSPEPTPVVTGPPRTPVPTPVGIVDPVAARAAVRNIGTALDNLAAQGAIAPDAAEELRLRASGIGAALDARDYDGAADRALALDRRVDELAAGGDLTPSAELNQEIDKLRAALPRR